jgi:uncharacterized protein (DUF2235 family)
MKALSQKVGTSIIMFPYANFPPITKQLAAISQDVRDAYGFICDNYSFYDDEIILIGFSRGAFTARALAALIKDVGVLSGAGRFCIDHVYGLW